MGFFRVRRAIVIVVAALAIGCQGERFSSLIETSTDEGRWRVDGTLIRSYNVTLQQAIDAILGIAADHRWIVRATRTEPHTADIDVKTRELVQIEFSIWAPPDRATEIGIEYADGDKIGSVRIFDLIERRLIGKRITVNRPE